MALQICAVSGTLRNVTGSAISGATVKATATRPFLHTGDNSLIANYETSTTTAADGTWTLSLVETVTPANSMTISFVFPSALNYSNMRKEYTVIVPNAPTATFASLIGSQI